MKLRGRHLVEGTEPTVTIGHRQYRDSRAGRVQTCRTYTAEFTEDGRQHQVALRTRNKSEAIRKVHRLLRDRREGKRGDGARPARIDRLRDEYLELLRNRGRAPKTLTKYEKVLGDFVDLCTKRGVLQAVRLEERDFWAYRVWADQRHLSPKTIHGHLILIKQLLKWADRAGRIPVNPIANVTVKEPPAFKQPCFTPEQVHALIETAEGSVKPMIATLAFTGMRVGELRELRWDDVDLDGGVIHIQRGGSASTTKTGRDRRVPIHPELAPVLRSLPRGSGRIFTRPPSTRRPDGDAPINERWLLKQVKELCRRCGFENPEQFKVHTFRHAFCPGLARRGVPDRVAMAFLGHRSSEILDLYYTLYDSDARQAMGALTYEPADENHLESAKNEGGI